MQRTRNPLRVQILRGFESHRFRQTGQKAAAKTAAFCFSPEVSLNKTPPRIVKTNSNKK